VIVGLIVVAIVLVLVERAEATGSSALVSAGDWLSNPFHGIFSRSSTRSSVGS
jgi:L-asparagine transporter-like permease